MKPADVEQAFNSEEPSQLTSDTDSIASLPIILDTQPQPCPHPCPHPCLHQNPSKDHSADVQEENDVIHEQIEGQAGILEVFQESCNVPEGIERDGMRITSLYAVK
jgi:hypothetical protein